MPGRKRIRLDLVLPLPARAMALIWALGLVGLGLAPAAAQANPDLARQKNCLACHNVDRKLVGPAFRDVAARYAGDRGALARLTKTVREGGVGHWGKIPMPANSAVNESDAQTLVRWILSIK